MSGAAAFLPSTSTQELEAIPTWMLVLLIPALTLVGAAARIRLRSASGSE